MAGDFDPALFMPSAQKIITPTIERIPSGSTYQKFSYTRPVYLFSLSPSTAGEIQYFPLRAPNGNEYLRNSAYAFFFAYGDWFIRHSGAGTEQFLVCDAGGVSDPGAVAAAVTSTPVVNVLDQARTFGAGAVATVAATSGTAIAANTNRRFLYVKNVSTTGQRITLDFAGAAVLDAGITLEVGEWRAWDALTGISQQAVRAIASAVGASLEYVEGA